MKKLILILILGCTVIQISNAQTDKFRFMIDGNPYLDIKENAGGFYTIHQYNSQTSMFFGYNSGINTIEDPGVFNSGSNNTAYGFNTLSSNTTGFQNTAIGTAALEDNIFGNANTAVGFGAMKNGTGGGSNVAIGQSTLYKLDSGIYNIAIGNAAFFNTNFGARSIAIGQSAGSNDTSSVDNVYVGNFAGRGTNLATDGYDRFNNVMIGSYSGYLCKTNGNVFLGFEAGRNAKVDNQLYITNSDTDSLNTLIYGQFDNEYLRFNGVVNIDGLYSLPTTAPTSGQYIRYSGGTQLSWGNIDAPWYFGTNDDVLYEDGDVGIGLGNAIYRFDVQDNVNNGYVARFHNAHNTSNSKGIIIQAGLNTNPTSSTYFAIFLDGNGTNIGGIRGNGAGGTMYSTTSDRRLKQNIKTFNLGLETINKINPTIYQMKSNPTKDEIGFIAQELQKVLPQAVSGNPEDDVEESPMMVDYSKLTPVIVAAIQEQQELINQQKSMISQLITRLEKQEQTTSHLIIELAKLNDQAEE
ncbi:MAG: hypothetical protein ACJA1A_002354 [Saprospiraceae bacterium]|jgi:hypothetical protein